MKGKLMEKYKRRGDALIKTGLECSFLILRNEG